MSRPRAWEERLHPLMAIPRVWLGVHRCATQERAVTDASHLRHGRLSRPPGRWEFRASTDRGVPCVEARYLGPDEQEAAS